MSNNNALSFLTVLILSISISVAAFPQENVIGEDTLKALYSYKFALFTNWPETRLKESGNTLEFCIIGKNPFGQTALDTIKSQPAKDKSIQVEIYHSGIVAEESLRHCHVAFISTSEAQRVPPLLNSLRSFPILTISDIPGFSNRGGMITLIKSGDHIKFEINLAAIKQADLAMSSKIIELATVVKTSNEGHN